MTDGAPGPSPPPAPPAPSLPTLPLARQLTFWAFASLIVLAIAFYLWWGVAFGVWLDNGVYAVFITLLGFGLAGAWLMTPNPTSAKVESR